MWRNISKYYSPLIDVLTFSILFITIFYVIFSFGKLPNEIPTHFNLQGEPDGWSNKGTLIGLMILYIHTTILCFVLNYFLIVKSDNTVDSLQMVNIPFIKKEELTEKQIILVKKNSARMLALMNLFVSILFWLIHYGIIQSGLGNQDGLGSGVMMTLGIILILTIFYTWKMYHDVRQARDNIIDR
ncbi:DUF1648 domain-containing protein [Oceanobacillus sp. J11TS1]|uniref:DUF1648 domain-containing protein n=1 Tax=Oceanobacillus sp. J11TS1 TaxID=2807191 RepID=UPI001B1A7CF8|nr:DUF1648 domain-containing protein [Oceanobacillus sp. J11TS1]GIO23542.1 hypothetical protein J11TS1_21230 [Oceanobacillus sp. J11TS1]